MHKLDNVAQAILTGQSPQLIESAQKRSENLQKSKLLEREEIIRLWSLMTEMYGHKWTSQFGAQIDPNNVWAASLRGLSSDQIKTGLNQCVVRHLDWPPSAPEFRKLCTGEDDVAWEHKAQSKPVHEIMADLYGLPDKGKQERAKKAGAAALAAMKKTVGG